ncbi:hypothetical protein COO60DRAFT_1168838 [Scenedesmus sp. NREL 46B-D3]|nr:hypothetical protein COO60DRAFT_1168838 [Scenedesmus sp. NREL 46B-D3]
MVSPHPHAPYRVLCLQTLPANSDTMLLPTYHFSAAAPDHSRPHVVVALKAGNQQPVSLDRCRRIRSRKEQHSHLTLMQCRAAADTPSSSSSSSSSSLPATLADSAASTSGRSAADSSSGLLTFAEVQQIAAARGLHMSLKTLGPGYRITCRDGGENGPILGATAGFVAPAFGLMHCDTLQVFTRGMKGAAGDRIRKNPLGLGLLLGGAVFSHGRSCSCRKAEILAINDDDAWHERLVRYYSYFGFKPVCKVGGQGFFQDLPHLLVWGGEGTRMDADIEEALGRWTPALRQSALSGKERAAARAAAAGSISSSIGSGGANSSSS